MRRSAWYVLAAASFLLAWLSPSVYASFEGGSWRLEWFSLSNPGIALVTLVYAVAIAGIAVLAAKLRHGYRFGYGTSLVAAWTIGGMAATGIFVLTNHYLVSDLGHTPLWEYWLGERPLLIMYAVTSLLASLCGLAGGKYLVGTPGGDGRSSVVAALRSVITRRRRQGPDSSESRVAIQTL